MIAHEHGAYDVFFPCMFHIFFTSIFLGCRVDIRGGAYNVGK